MVDSNQQFLDQLEQMNGGQSQSEPTGDEGKIQYTSHPTKTYKIGKWRFENALLTLKDAEDEAKFLEAINHEDFPERERHMIKKLDTGAAERISREYRMQGGGATKQFDSTVGERGEKAKVGVGDLLSTHKRPAELGLEAAAEGGREQNVPGAPDSNRETQTEPSPQLPPETPFRAEQQGRGGNASAEQILEEIEENAGGAGEKAEAAIDSLERGKPADVEEAPAVESDKTTPEGKLATDGKLKGFGKPLLAGDKKD